MPFLRPGNGARAHPQRKTYIRPPKDLFEDVHDSFIVIAPHCKQPKCPPAGKQTHKWWHMHTVVQLVNYCCKPQTEGFQRHRPEWNKPNAKVQEQEKRINCDRSQSSGFHWEVLIRSRSEGTFWVTGSVIFIHLVRSQRYPYETIHQSICFTLYLSQDVFQR